MFFFTEQTNNLITIIDNDLIKFKVAFDSIDTLEFAYFEVDTLKIKALSYKFKNVFNKKIYTAYEIDNYLLNHLDDLGEYYKKGIIDIDYVNNGFGYYIDCVHDNDQIKKYIQCLNAEERSRNAYVYFEYIFNQLKNYNKKRYPLIVKTHSDITLCNPWVYKLVISLTKPI